jgi:hypothetical protein
MAEKSVIITEGADTAGASKEDELIPRHAPSCPANDARVMSGTRK